MPAEIKRLSAAGGLAYVEGRYSEARQIYQQAAVESLSAGLPAQAAAYLNNAGGCSVASRHFRDAMEEFRQARKIASESHSWASLAYTMNNLTSLYLQMLNPEAAAQTAKQALTGPEGRADAVLAIKLRFQLASAMARMRQFDDALPLFREAIFEMEEKGDLETTAYFWSAMGGDALETGRYDVAEKAYTEAFRMVRIHNLKNSATILCGLAKVRSHRGDSESAAVLFDAALAAPPGLSARWVLLSDRGRFRLDHGDATGALQDFRKARRIVATLRADMVPADQDRIAMESGIGQVMDGLVEAGNRVAIRTGDARLVAETFDAAEQDRAWSLRALIPSDGDWRSKLPESYWEILSQYQSNQRAVVARGESRQAEQGARLSVQLAEMEAAAEGKSGAETDGSAARHLQSLLDRDSVLLSFHLGKNNAWVWAVEKNRMQAFSLGDSKNLESAAERLTRAMREGVASDRVSQELYQLLFGMIPAERLRHERWLLELDSALFAVPFGALVVEAGEPPVYLIQRAAIQIVPGALLLKRGSVPKSGVFVGAGDAVYNTADSRYRGTRGAAQLALPRLPNTAAELESCAREWSPGRSRVLTGAEATTASSLQAAMEENTAILHFATHVVAAPGDHKAGMIALSLDRTGRMGLVGPKEILARPVKAALVVMNGCHSAQGEALPSTGLMGLTRAWIGSGAGAVVATQWDIPDEAAQGLMKAFYRALRAAESPNVAAALRQAQLESLQAANSVRNPKNWAGYFLLSRLL